jgi:hypothetical protein
MFGNFPLKASAAIALTLGAAFAQTAASGPTFEVASIKPSTLTPAAAMAAGWNVGAKIDAARVDMGLASLALLIRMAYNVKPYQLSGPDWMTTARFDVVAKLPEGADATGAAGRTVVDMTGLNGYYIQRPRCLRRLVGYALACRRRRTAQRHAVSFPRHAGKLKHTPPLTKRNNFHVYQVAMPVPGTPNSGRMAARGGMGPGAGDAGKSGDTAADPAGSIFASVQKLGLRLEKRQAPVEQIVVEHLEKVPTEN